MNGSGWNTATFEEGAWSTNFTIGTLEGIYVQNGINEARYVVSGVFDTNIITKALPTGLSAISLPLYHINPTNTWIIDTFNTNHLGGLSGLPVQTTGFSPQCTVYQLINSTNVYSTNILTSSNVWQHAFTNTVVRFQITEGFFIDKPTNATWNVSRAIW